MKPPQPITDDRIQDDFKIAYDEILAKGGSPMTKVIPIVNRTRELFLERFDDEKTKKAAVEEFKKHELAVQQQAFNKITEPPKPT